jgi:ssDNA-binding Zn-finger/Zn-ribbon topoisomerase 1
MPSSCPKCGKPLEVYTSKGIKYLDCSGYPECRYRVEIGKVNQSISIEEEGGKITYPKNCPNCNKKLVIILGKNGAFFSCSGYPNCIYTISIDNLKNIKCPTCGKLMYERTGKYGIFLGCEGYPNCKATYSIRISKDSKNTHSPAKNEKKKLDLPELKSPMSNDKIYDILSEEWHTIDQIADRLNLNDDNDIRFLKLKLKKLERENFLSTKLKENQYYWKIS